MRILGLDIGRKRIGVALSDELGITAQGLKTIERTSEDQSLKEIKGIVTEFNIKEIIAGLPLNMNGTKGPGTDEVVKFTDKLKEMIDRPVKMWDERLTTMEAERLLISSDISRKKRKGKKDRIAAQLILQSYLSYRKSKDA